MIEKPQFYLIVYCLTHDEKQKELIHPNIGFFVKLNRQYHSKEDALSKEQHAKNEYVIPCSRQHNQRIYPTLGIFDEKEYEQNKNNPVFNNWKTMTPEELSLNVKKQAF